jgi:hypothetical protein
LCGKTLSPLTSNIVWHSRQSKIVLR